MLWHRRLAAPWELVEHQVVEEVHWEQVDQVQQDIPVQLLFSRSAHMLPGGLGILDNPSKHASISFSPRYRSSSGRCMVW